MLRFHVWGSMRGRRREASFACGGSGARRSHLREEGRDPLRLGLVDHDVSGLRDGLDARVVVAAADAHVALLAPVVVPGVLDGPVLHALLLAPAHEEHGVVHALPPVRARRGRAGLVDALRVVHEVVLRLHADDEGAVLLQLPHHLALVRAAVVAADVAVLVRARGRTGALGLQQALLVALLVVRALPARGVARARRRHEPDVLAPAAHEHAVAALAALVVLRAVQREGDGEGHGLGAGLDLVARGEHAHRRDDVARPAVALVHDRLERGAAVRHARAPVK